MRLLLNHKLIHANEAMVSVFDHGFLYGIGLFETFRTYNSKPFLLKEHLERLQAGCTQLGISNPIDEHMLRQEIGCLLAENKLEDGYFRLTVSAGEGELGLPTDDYGTPTVLLQSKPLPSEKTVEEWQVGKTAVMLGTLRNSPESTVRYKSLHFMNNVLAKRELRQRFPQYATTAEGIMLNAQGHVTEGIVSNIVFRKGHKVYTPSIATGILPGITRAYVIKLCQDHDVEVEEGLYSSETLLEADEAWLTNSIQAITPITCFVDKDGQKHVVGNGVAGELTIRLHKIYIASTDSSNS